LHVLGLPPAFALSQDQTLKLDEILISADHTFCAQQRFRVTANFDEVQHVIAQMIAHPDDKCCS
jgi:hypothetical protein